LVDVNEFLKPVVFQDTPEDGYPKIAHFPVDYNVTGLEALSISVDTKPVLEVQGTPPPCLDFSLVGEDAMLTRGYRVSIGTQAVPDVLSFVFNAMGCPSVNSLAFQRLDYTQRAKRKAE